MSPSEPTENNLFALVLYGRYKPCGFQSNVFWGHILGVLDIRTNPSLLREKLGVVSSLLIVQCCTRFERVYGKSMSQSFLPIST